jgi:hypothetical protein
MANLLGQNIGTNYKGILNLNTLNGNLSGTLQAVTDGDGNVSPLQLSTTQVGITGPVQTGTGSLYNPLRIGYSNSTISVTNLDLFSVGATANSGSRYSTILRLGGGSDTAQHFIYGGEGNSTGLVLDRGSSNVSIIGSFSTTGITSLFSGVVYVASNYANVQANLGIGFFGNGSARLQVRGDGTNPIARFENSGGTASHIFKDTTALEFGTQGIFVSATANGTTTSTAGRGLLFSGVSGQAIYQFNFVASSNSETSGTYGGINLTTAVAVASGTPNFRPLNIAYTINNVGTPVSGTATGIFLNATETALNGMTHNLMDLQTTISSVSTSQFRVSRDGQVNATNFIASGVGIWDGSNLYRAVDTEGIGIFNGGSATAGITIYGSANGTSFLRNKILAKTDFIALGAINDATAPAIKRNSAAIDFRLANDSAACAVNAASFSTASVIVGSNYIVISGDTGLLRPAASTLGITLNGFSNTHFEFRKNDDTTVVGIIKGTGSPEAVITANQGSIFMRTDGGSGTTFYVKESGTGNTGWVAK